MTTERDRSGRERAVEGDRSNVEDLERVRDVVGIGLGPFDLGLAALIEGNDEIDIDALFLEQKPSFSWHEGMLIENATLEVPFLADVVTLADPTSPYSYLNYLKETDRLYEFYFYETFQTPRREYDAYCRWVAERLEAPRFSRRVVDVRPVEHPTANFLVTAVRPDDATVDDKGVAGTNRSTSDRKRTDGDRADEGAADSDLGDRERFAYLARDLVVGVGTKPYVPEEFRDLAGDSVFHTARYRYNRSNALDAGSVAVIGSGQSAAEVFQDLLARQPDHGYRLDWVTRSDGFFPMEYSKLGLQHFAPEYVEYVVDLPQSVRDDFVPEQDLLYKGIDPGTSAEIYETLYRRSVGGDRPDVGMIAMTEVRDIDRTETGRYRLDCEQWQAETAFSFESSAVVLGTGYHRPTPSFLDGIRDRIERDDEGRLEITRGYALRTDIEGSVYVQNAGLHTHGVGTPDLGLGTYRNVVIMDQLLEESPYSVADDTVYQDFSPESFVRSARAGSIEGADRTGCSSDDGSAGR